jgi:hypothetical protein
MASSGTEPGTLCLSAITTLPQMWHPYKAYAVPSKKSYKYMLTYVAKVIYVKQGRIK